MAAALGREQDMTPLRQLRILADLDRSRGRGDRALKRPASPVARTAILTVDSRRDTDALIDAKPSMIRVRCPDGEAPRTPPDCQDAAPVLARHGSSPAARRERAVTREAPFVERLAYTRSQAAEALGLSRSTFTRRVLPYVETVEMPWGSKLIPVDELERLLAEQQTSRQATPSAARSRSPAPPARRGHQTNPNRASRRRELATDSGRPQHRPDPDRTRRHDSGGPQPFAPPWPGQIRVESAPQPPQQQISPRSRPSYLRAIIAETRQRPFLTTDSYARYASAPT